jgi:plasmid stability protein
MGAAPRDIWPLSGESYSCDVAVSSMQTTFDQFRWADEFGFDWVTVTEHRYSSFSLTPKPDGHGGCAEPDCPPRLDRDVAFQLARTLLPVPHHLDLATARAKAAPAPLHVRLEHRGREFAALDMGWTCLHVYCMSGMIQIRNVPEALHRRLKSRAALAGMSLSDYLLNQIREVAERPTLDELRARLERRSGATLPVEPAEAIRAERDRR